MLVAKDGDSKLLGRTTRRVLSWITIGVVVTSSIVLSGPALAAACKKRGAGWTSLTPAKLVNSLTVESDPIAVSVDGRTLVAANNQSIEVSSDGGCSWKQVWTVPLASADYPLLSMGTLASIRSLSVEGKGSKTSIYAALTTLNFLSPATVHVIYSHDGGKTWTQSSDVFVGGLLSTTPVIRAAPSKPDTVYLQVPTGGYYLSKDGAKTWTAQTDPSEATRRNGYNFVVDPTSPDELWEWSGALIRHSKDGAKSWEEVKVPEGLGGTYLDIFHDKPNRPTRLVIGSWAYDSEAAVWRNVFFGSGNGGGTWKPLAAPPYQIVGLAHGRSPDSVVAFTWNTSTSPASYNIWRYNPKAKQSPWADITPSYPVAFSCCPNTFQRPTSDGGAVYFVNTPGGDIPMTIEKYSGK